MSWRAQRPLAYAVSSSKQDWELQALQAMPNILEGQAEEWGSGLVITWCLQFGAAQSVA